MNLALSASTQSLQYIYMYRIPKEETLQQQWLDALKIEEVEKIQKVQEYAVVTFQMVMLQNYHF